VNPHPYAALPAEQREAALLEWLEPRLGRYLGRTAIDPFASLAEYGLDSLAALNLYGDIEDEFELLVDPTVVLEYPTLDSLAKHLAGRFEASPAQTARERSGK
jgi:acyl carrier protein